MRTLLDVLQIPRFSDLTLLTEPSFAKLPLDSIEISETPDISFYIPENTFLLTTAMIYRDDQTKLFELIDSLQEKMRLVWESRSGVLSMPLISE